ncbi:MAG: hypothetical protein QOE31_982 [Solirubrobacteraceae bacterium]|jgi:hypothetical protein|nr:hypothetical protein [Solirubrobacteraceae bacterium]
MSYIKAAEAKFPGGEVEVELDVLRSADRVRLLVRERVARGERVPTSCRNVYTIRGEEVSEI